MQWPWISRKRHLRELESLKAEQERSNAVRTMLLSDALAGKAIAEVRATDVWGGRTQIPIRRA